MNNYLTIFKETLLSMISLIESKGEYLIGYNTGICDYLKKALIIIKNKDEYFNDGLIDLKNKKILSSLHKIINDTNKISINSTKYRQCLDFLCTINVFNKIETDKYKLINDNLVETEFNRNFFENHWIWYMSNNQIQNTHIKIIFSFYVYSLTKILSKSEFSILIEMANNEILKENVKQKFSGDLLYPIRSMVGTYEKFYCQYFNYDINEFISFSKNIISGKYETTNLEKNNVSGMESNSEIHDDFINKKVNDILFILSDTSEDVRSKTKRNKIAQCLRKEFRENLISKFNENECLFSINNRIFDNEYFLEGAHIISIEKIIDTIEKYYLENRIDIIENIIRKFSCSDNGILIPFNYHKLYDSGYIEISNRENKFVLTELGKKNIKYLEMLGFNECNNIDSKKYQEILKIIDEYKKILED